MGLGFLLGKRFLLLEHRGRKTGIRRRTVLEVVDREGGVPVVVSGFGPGSDWLQNVLAQPYVGVTWGSRRFDAVAHRLTVPEAIIVFRNYRREHPRAAAFLGRVLGVSIVDDAQRAAEWMPVIRFHSGRG
jgi:deazaflavin-dependent oxidoreductase (nitroreductase family)